MIHLFIKTFNVGMLSTNCYLAISIKSKEAILLDPGLEFSSEAKQIFDYISTNKLKVKFVVNTHGHDDHTKANILFQQKLNIPIYIHSLDAHFIKNIEKCNFPTHILLEDGDIVKFGDEILKVMHTPGHTPGSICLVGENLIFTGDTLFAGGIGRTDFTGGSMSEMRFSLKKLVSLPDSLFIYPGHGVCSTIGKEKKTNPFLDNIDQDMIF